MPPCYNSKHPPKLRHYAANNDILNLKAELQTSKNKISQLSLDTLRQSDSLPEETFEEEKEEKEGKENKRHPGKDLRKVMDLLNSRMKQEKSSIGPNRKYVSNPRLSRQESVEALDKQLNLDVAQIIISYIYPFKWVEKHEIFVRKNLKVYTQFLIDFISGYNYIKKENNENEQLQLQKATFDILNKKFSNFSPKEIEELVSLVYEIECAVIGEPLLTTSSINNNTDSKNPIVQNYRGFIPKMCIQPQATDGCNIQWTKVNWISKSLQSNKLEPTSFMENWKLMAYNTHLQNLAQDISLSIISADIKTSRSSKIQDFKFTKGGFFRSIIWEDTITEGKSTPVWHLRKELDKKIPCLVNRINNQTFYSALNRQSSLMVVQTVGCMPVFPRNIVHAAFSSKYPLTKQAILLILNEQNSIYIKPPFVNLGPKLET